MHRVRLYPSASQIARLGFMLRVTRDLYNALLDERRYAWTARRLRVSTRMQYAEVTALRAEDARLEAVYRECQDAVLHRLDLAFAAFFRRVKSGETPGYPRFKPASRWHQLEFPHGDRALKLNERQDRVKIPKIGTVRVRKGRGIPEFGRAFVTEKNGRWYATFECERQPKPLPGTGRMIGVDRGVHVLAATSEGELIPNARANARHQRLVTGLARELDAVTEKDSRGRCLNRRDPKRFKAVRRLARAKEREANARLHHAHVVALELVRENDIIALERLNLRAMTKSAKGTVEKPGRNVRAKAGLNRVVLDAGFGLLRRLIGEKAEYAVRQVIDVDARYSSQTCGHCLHVSAKNRRRRRFVCVACGWTCHADVAAALEIRRRAQLERTSALSPGRPRLGWHDAA